MTGRVAGYLGRHHWGILATFIALGGTAYASGALPFLPPNSVGTRQIQARAVTLGKINREARTTLRHPVGRAGGALIGTYPNPSIAPPPVETKASYITGRAIGTNWGWEDYGPPYLGASYYRDTEGVVHLAGVVKSFGGGSDPNVATNQCASNSHTISSIIFVLPSGDRPAFQHDFAVDSGDTFGRIDVMRDGSVACVSGAGDKYVSLDGITFRAGG